MVSLLLYNCSDRLYPYVTKYTKTSIFKSNLSPVQYVKPFFFFFLQISYLVDKMARLSEFHFTPRTLQNAISVGDTWLLRPHGMGGYEGPWPGVDPWVCAGWRLVRHGLSSPTVHSAGFHCLNLTSFRAW